MCTDGLSQTCAIIASHTSAPACNRRFSAATAAAAEAAAPAHTCHLSWWLWPMQAHSLHQPHSHSTPTLQRLHCWAAIAHGKAQIELKFELLGSHIIRCRYWAAMSLPAAAGRPHHPLPIHWAAILGGHIIRCRCWAAMSLPAAGRPPRVTVSAQQGQVWGLMRSCCWA